MGLMDLFNSFFKKKKDKIPVVLAINAVDLIEPGDWNTRINQPSVEQEKNIKKICERLVKEFSRVSGLPTKQIVYYSALRYYRTTELLTAMISATKEGFVLGTMPVRTFVDQITDPKMLAVLEKERQNNPEMARQLSANPADLMVEAMKKELNPEDFKKFKETFDRRMATPPKIMFLGKTGVGKTTTVAALLGKDLSDFSVNHSSIGTHDVEVHTLEYPNGDKTGKVEIFDVPGYGTLDDTEYAKMYEDTLQKCDVVVLMIQANAKAYAADQRILKQLVSWCSENMNRR